MRKSLLLLFGGFIFLSSTVSLAQNKFALLVGINDYYSEPGVKSSHSLQGCVNDMMSMKTLLVDRFAFQPSNILTLSDSQATKKTILGALKTVLDKCNPGDAMVFFYSGHGVWIDNKATIDDPVKRGLSQAIVTSDLYADNWECLLKDVTLKKSFNRFIDKKIKVTTIFDCCYSGNVMMMPGAFGENVYDRLWSRSTEKFIDLNFISYIPKEAPPRGCAADTNRLPKDTVDTDQDGVPDCADYEINTPLACHPVSAEGIGNCEEEDIAFLPDQKLEASPNDSMIAKQALKDSRAFNLVDAISIPDSEVVARPSERPNSGFLSISATSDKEKGLEISDEAGIKRGAFTKALLTVYKENPATLSVNELLKKISAQIARQRYRQTATYHYDPGRLAGNLIGTDPARFNKSTIAKCTDVKGGVVVLDKGSNAGIAKGNVFTTTGITGNLRVQVIQAEANRATATPIDLRMTGIKPGTEFILSDPYTISEPLVKVYIGSSKLNAATFNVLFDKKVKPFVNRPNYRDYNLWTNLEISLNIFFSETSPRNPTVSNSIENGDTTLFNVFLPIPGFIADAFKQVLLRNQNIEIVDSESKAEFMLYLNYAKQRAQTPAEFVFTFCKPIVKDVNEMGDRPYFAYNVKSPTLNLNNTDLAKLAEKINDCARQLIRGKTSRWLNDYKKR